MTDKPPKKLDCPRRAACCQTAGLGCGCQYSAGLGLAPLGLASAALVSAPLPYMYIWLVCHSRALDPAPGLGSWAVGEIPASTSYILHISILERKDCPTLQPGTKVLVVIVTPERLCSHTCRASLLWKQQIVDILTVRAHLLQQSTWSVDPAMAFQCCMPYMPVEGFFTFYEWHILVDGW